jgi:hypothetical protein
MRPFTIRKWLCVKRNSRAEHKLVRVGASIKNAIGIKNIDDC